MQDDIAALCAALVSEIGPGPWTDRDLVETLVSRGQITPEQAEEWAAQHDEPPFEHYPDPSTRDPMGEPYWTLTMALAWIAWRTPTAVRICWSSYVPRCQVWRGYLRGYRLMPLEIPSIGDINWKIQVAEVDRDPTLKVSSDNAMHQLENALKEGHPLIARHGIKNIQVIPARSWDVLCPLIGATDCRKPDAVFDRDGELLFERVRVDRDAVLILWPTLPVADVIEQVGDKMKALDRPTVRTENDDIVPATASGSRPRLTGERLRAMMNDPRMNDTTNSNDFLSETRRRAKVQGYNIDQTEVRALYKNMYGHKSAGRPSRKSRPEIS